MTTYYQQNRERLLEKQNEYNRINIDNIKAYRKEWYKTITPEQKARMRANTNRWNEIKRQERIVVKAQRAEDKRIFMEENGERLMMEHKEKMKLKARVMRGSSPIVHCDCCGKDFKKYTINRHNKSKKHKKNLEAIQN